MTNRPIRLWAITTSDHCHGKIVGRRVDHSTIRYLRRDAIAAWKGYYPKDKGDAMWDKYRKEYDLRVERVVVTVEEKP